LKSSTNLGFVFGINWLRFFNKLLVAMSKLALVPVSANTYLNPILAHLCLILGLIGLQVQDLILLGWVIIDWICVGVISHDHRSIGAIFFFGLELNLGYDLNIELCSLWEGLLLNI